jgi:site-specific DNA-methyltransferase (adenine-specific)
MTPVLKHINDLEQNVIGGYHGYDVSTMTLVLKHGDCLELMRDLSDGVVDLIICDLPYGCLTPQTYGGVIDKSGSDLGKTYGEKITWDIKIDLPTFWKEVKRIRRNDHSPCIHFCTTKFGAELIASNPDEFRYDLVWDKGKGVSFLSANKMPMRSHEMLYVFSKKGTYYNRVDYKGDFTEYKQYGKANSDSTYGIINRKKPITRPVGTITSSADKRCVLSVIKNFSSSKKGGHPTQKPADLYRWLLERYCPPGGTVLDPTFGSGNSVFTAYDMGLHAIGFEKDETFYKKAVGRIPSEDIIQHL